MSIPKPIRHLIQLALLIVLAAALSQLALRLRPIPLAIFAALLAVPSAFIAALVVSLCVDRVDLWLRRRSRDSLWLITDEGREWLASDEGKEWQRENETKRIAGP
jgi:hypothetical protein